MLKLTNYKNWDLAKPKYYFSVIVFVAFNSPNHRPLIKTPANFKRRGQTRPDNSVRVF